MPDMLNMVSGYTHNEHPPLREEVPAHQQTGTKEQKYSLLLLVSSLQVEYLNANSIEGRRALSRLKLNVLVKD